MGLQDADELTGRGGSGVDEADGGSGYSLQDGQQERVMRTPEHDRICAGAQERLEAFPDGRLGQRAIELQALDEFDLKTSSWIETPAEIRCRGGALFCERRYGTVFTFHNGADSYYSVRGWRGYILV